MPYPKILSDSLELVQPPDRERQTLLDEKVPDPLQTIQAQLKLYTRNNSRIRRIFHGEWNHHHIRFAHQLTQMMAPNDILIEAMKHLPLDFKPYASLGKMLDNLCFEIHHITFAAYRRDFWNTEEADPAFRQQAKTVLSNLFWNQYAKCHKRYRLIWLDRHHVHIAQKIHDWCLNDDFSVQDILSKIRSELDKAGSGRVNFQGKFYASLDQYSLRYFGSTYNEVMIRLNGPIKRSNMDLTYTSPEHIV